MLASWASRWRTDRCSLAWAAVRRMRWAICRARTQVKTWTRMSCSVQRRIGGKDHVRVFHLAEGELGFGLDRYRRRPRYGPVVVIGDQHVLAEDFLFQRGAGGRVDGPGQPQVLRLVAGQLPGDDAADRGPAGDRLDSAWTLSFLRRVLPRARVTASSSSFLPALARVAPSNPWAWAACSSVSGSRRCGAGAVGLAAGVAGGQATNRSLSMMLRWRRQAVRSGSRWRDRPMQRSRRWQVGEVAGRVLPASKTTVMSARRRTRPRRRPPGTGRAADQ